MYHLDRFYHFKLVSNVFSLIGGNGGNAGTLVNTKLVQSIKRIILSNHRGIGAMDSGGSEKFPGTEQVGSQTATRAKAPTWSKQPTSIITTSMAICLLQKIKPGGKA